MSEQGIPVVKRKGSILKRIERALSSKNEDKQWQAAISLGVLAAENPDLAWPLVVKFGSSRSLKVRSAIASCVLEHVLESHFHPFFERTAELIRGGNRHFAKTFCMCWKFGQSNKRRNSKLFDALLKECGRNPSL